jgi:hypothetical protein
LSEADLRNSIGLTENQINSARGSDGTQLPTTLPHPWLHDDDLDVDEETLVYEDESSEIPAKVIAPLQAYWSGQRLIASLDTQISSKIPISDAAGAVTDRLYRLKSDLTETNADRRLLQLIDDISDALQTLTRRNVFTVGFATDEFQYSHDRLKAELSPVLEGRMMSCIVSLRSLLSMFPDWQEFESAKELANFKSAENLEIGISESKAFIDAMLQRSAVVDVGIPNYLTSLRDSSLIGPTERFGYFSSMVNVLSRMFSAVLDDVSEGAQAAIAEETKTAIKWILRISAGMVVWFITYVTGAYPWIKAAWQVIKSLL